MKKILAALAIAAVTMTGFGAGTANASVCRTADLMFGTCSKTYGGTSTVKPVNKPAFQNGHDNRRQRLTSASWNWTGRSTR